MENKILIIFNEETNLTDSVLYLMEKEKINYTTNYNLENIDDDVSIIIYIDNNIDLLDKLNNLKIPVLFIGEEKKEIQNSNTIINYILTNLVHDNKTYSDVQKEFLFKKGIYSILNSKILDFINDENSINGLVTDITGCTVSQSDWIFKFDSIMETYNWISNKNKSGSKDFVKKEINFFNEGKVYNDSSKEINYLIDKIVLIKSGIKLIDIFLCTKEELIKLKNNYFFKALLNNLSSTYNIYFVDKEIFYDNEAKLLDEITDGIIIYDDCVYRDTYDDEYSLGFVDCNKETIQKYNKYFDYILDKYGKKINSDGDIDGI